MEINLFSDAIDAIGTVIKGIGSIKKIPLDDRNYYRGTINETCVFLDTALLLVINRLGDILLIEKPEPFKFAEELLALNNFKEWQRIEREVRLCKNLRVIGREMNDLWIKCVDKISIHDSEELKSFIINILYGERELADYISDAMDRFTQLGNEVLKGSVSIENAKSIVRDVRDALLKERLKLITLQAELLDRVI